jgi:hypothetical protein
VRLATNVTPFARAVRHTVLVNPHLLTTTLILLMVACGAARAAAQVGYVQGGMSLDARRFSGEADNRVFDANARTVWIGGGGFLTPNLSAGIELELGPDSEVTQSVTVTIAGRPETVATTYGSRRRTVSALFGVHTPARNAVRIGAYAGLAFTAFRRRIVTDVPPIVLSGPPPPAVFTDRAGNPIVGLDVAASIGRNVAVVATVRAQALDFSGELNGFSLRPGAAVRISF